MSKLIPGYRKNKFSYNKKKAVYTILYDPLDGIDVREFNDKKAAFDYINDLLAYKDRLRPEDFIVVDGYAYQGLAEEDFDDVVSGEL